MFPLAVLILWAGYGVGSWGWCLNRGYNVTLREWFTPLTPFDWTGVKYIPCGQIFPKVNAGVEAPPDCGGGGPTLAQQGVTASGAGATYSKKAGGWTTSPDQNPLTGATT